MNNKAKYGWRGLGKKGERKKNMAHGESESGEMKEKRQNNEK